ncbi:Methyltransferase domain-containing protein (fragment) [Candidatus Defluviicoccus seviourii]|uniref:Methyltransferase domain-containing protein n=1 Tax=Candidatus Defluviicoccus seviourii TaxID=2565273 RepID=A0A564WCX2_9PROT
MSSGRGGVIRIAVPDLRICVERYLTDQDGDKFVQSLCMMDRNPQGIIERVRMAILGFRGHKWIYDGQSLATALMRAGFVDAELLPAGVTRIADTGALDLCERAEESVYVEARKP